MSLLETAKRHQLNSEKYLSYLLECLPNEETLVNKEVLEAYHHDQCRSGSVVQEFLGDYSGYVHCDILRQ
ncbi:transposase [Streptococcus pneumoniae]|nr:transposase [Streptococcus pneumoniae]